MFCAKCGKENKDDVNFCAYCGMAIGREQAPTSSRGVATKCSVCSKELSSSEVRFSPSTGFKPFCAGCVGMTVSRTDTPTADPQARIKGGAPDQLGDADLEARIKAWTPAQFADQAERGRRVQEAKRAVLMAAESGPPFDLGRIHRTIVESLLAARVFRDGYTGETTAAEPMPDVTTEAGMAEATKEIEEFNLFQGKMIDMLEPIITEKVEKTRGQGKAGQPEPPKAIVDYMLASRAMRDRITGESTLITGPSPYLMTEAEMVKEMNEFSPIIEKETQRLKELKGDQRH